MTIRLFLRIICFIIIHKLTAYGWHRDPFNYDIVKCMRTRRKFKIDFLESKASSGKNVFYIFYLFFHIPSHLP